MASPSQAPSDFITRYQREWGQYQRAAERARTLVDSILREKNVPIHAVQSRAKDVSSIRRKLRKKSYKNPDAEITDKIGVRVICHYSTDVDRARAALEPEFKVSRKHSVDKRGVLGPSEFGYRSLHLVVKLRASRARSPEYSGLADQWIEVQLRSLLEHAWAEIEHEIVYKSGVQFPRDSRRRFASLAGTLEILDREFVRLRSERDTLIDSFAERLKSGSIDWSETLDSVRLIGLLEELRPSGQSFRSQLGAFPPHAEAMCVEALAAVTIDSCSSLRTAVEDSDTADRIEAYAAANSLAPTELSHFAVILCILASRSPSIIEDYFPEYISEPGLLADAG